MLAAAFEQMLAPEMVGKAVAQAEAYAKENGVLQALKAFHNHLPRENMLCDLTSLLPPSAAPAEAASVSMLATRWCEQVQIKMSEEVYTVLRAHFEHFTFHGWHSVDYGVVGPSGPHRYNTRTPHHSPRSPCSTHLHASIHSSLNSPPAQAPLTV